MIGRFTKLGVYRELLRSRDFYLTILAGILALVSFKIDYNAKSSLLRTSFALLSVGINGFPIIWGALRGLIKGHVNVDELVGIAIIASLVQGEFLTAAAVSFVMTFGALIEQVTSESARRAIKSLVGITPQTATIVTESGHHVVQIDRVKTGDRVLIKPGERIPVDAVIVSGVSAIDESAMTGEPIPREKRVGDAVLAGTLNHNGVLEARAVNVGKDTTLGKVIKLVQEAESHRPEAVRLIDRYARWFTPIILACAAAAWVITGDAGRAVAVLIVGCPCALILAAPTATVAALGRAAKSGILVKGGQYLEKAASVKAVLFDKTGTLTVGRPRVEEIACTDAINEEELLSCAASAEQNCTHPLARAILKAAHYAEVMVSGAENAFHEIGLGVRAIVNGSLVEVGNVNVGEGKAALPQNIQRCLRDSMARGSTPLVVYRDHVVLGVLNVSDQVRPLASRAADEFKSLGINHMAIVSGDHKRAVERVADSIGIDSVFAGLKPHEKVDIIGRYQSRGLPVMFIGDGINDAPALASSHVGAAMGAAGTDVALETAHIALTHDDISKLPWLIRLSRRNAGNYKNQYCFWPAF